jgi:hypothetical protein
VSVTHDGVCIHFLCTKAFTCRLTLGHLDDFGEALSSVVFRRMRDNKRAWILPGEPFWNCPHCKVDIKMSKKRCFLCQRWKDGKRIDEHSERTSAGTVTLESTASSLASATVTKGSSPNTLKVWECYVCFHLNHWKKYNCGGCGRRAGGRTIDVPLAQAEDTIEAADVSAMNPKPGASVAASFPPGQSPNRKRRNSSTAKLWECVHCSYQNNMRNPKCARCGKAGEGGKVVNVKLKHALILDVKEPAVPSAGPDQLICPKCTFTNHVSYLSCNMCAALQSGKGVYEI